MSAIKNKVLTKIEDKKPNSYNYYLFVDLLRAFVIAFIFFMGGVLLAFLLWDWLLIPQIIDFNIDNIIFILFRLLPLIAITTVLFCFLAYYIYRQTDWLLVKKRILIAVLGVSAILLCMSSSLAIINHSHTLQKSLRDIDNNLQDYPIRPPRPRELVLKRRLNNVIYGRVVSIEKVSQGNLIKIANRNQVLSFYLSEELSTGISPRDLLRLELDEKEESKVLRVAIIKRTQFIFENQKIKHSSDNKYSNSFV
ncbi:MAG: hypothetical protein AAGF07_04000 [Patescibacteria group bacterium]